MNQKLCKITEQLFLLKPFTLPASPRG